MLREMVEKLEAEEGHIEMTLPVLRREGGAGVRREEPDGLRGDLHRRDPEGRAVLRHEGGGAGDQPVPLLEEDLRVRRAQPALARHGHRAHQATSSGSRRSSTWSRSRPRASSTACSSAPTRSTSPSAPTTTRSSSRTWCATSPRCSTCDERIDALRGRVGELRVDPQPQRLRADREGQTRALAAILLGFSLLGDAEAQDYAAPARPHGGRGRRDVRRDPRARPASRACRRAVRARDGQGRAPPPGAAGRAAAAPTATTRCRSAAARPSRSPTSSRCRPIC